MSTRFVLMIRRPPRSTRTDTGVPSTTRFRSGAAGGARVRVVDGAKARARAGEAGADYVLEDQIGHLLRRAHQRHAAIFLANIGDRSEEHTSELQSLMRISYAVFCLKKKNNKYTQQIRQLIMNTRHKNKL